MTTSISRRTAAQIGLLAPLSLLLAACSAGSEAGGSQGASGGTVKDEATHGFRDTDLGVNLGTPTPVELGHATQFTLDSYESGHQLLCMANGDRLLIVPESQMVPDGLVPSVGVVQQPLSNVYLVSTAMICLVDAIGALDAVGVSSVKAEDSPVSDFTARLDDGSISYGGIYREPDYELIAAVGCPLAIENTNIDHVPEVRAKLEELGVTVLMEQSSREDSMLGRLEWIRVMGALFDRNEEAAKVYEDVSARVKDVSGQGSVGKTVAFFYINEDGAAVTRREGDYFCQMIEAAGGTYVSFTEEGAADSSPTTVTVEMERFYEGARDADVIIYNGTIDEGVSTLEALVEKNGLLADFRAVQNGDVWTCDSSLYQQITSMADIIEELRAALTGSSEGGRFFWRLG